MLLGKTLSKQSKNSEARAVYEKGCQATQGENPYVWQVSLKNIFLILQFNPYISLLSASILMVTRSK